MRTHFIAAALLAVTAGAAMAQQSGGAGSATGPGDAYRPYEFLVGEWVSEQGSSTIRQSIRWGPKRAYMIYSTSLQNSGSPEHLHFEGIMAWNAKTRALDYLFAVEPGSGTLERGSVRAEADGSFVRDVEMIRPNGALSLFRQTIRPASANGAVTSMMAFRNGNWEPTFPGSDRIEMRRRD